MNNIQNKPKRGGARPGAGRRVGTTNKISGETILAAIKNETGENFEQHLARGYNQSIIEDDKPTRLQYEKMFLNKVVAEKVDVTTNGETLGVQLVFSNKELPDWHDETNKD